MLNVLLASKDETVAEQLSRIIYLKNYNYQLERVFSLEQCREKLVLIRPHVLFLDLGIFSSRQSALQFVMTIRISYQESKIIILGKIGDSAEIVRSFFKDGVFDYLFNPLEDNILTDILYLVSAKIEHENKEKDVITKRNKFNNIFSSLQSSLVYDLIYGNLRNAKEIWERSKMAGLSSIPNIAMVINIDNFNKLTADKSEHWKQMVGQELYQLVQETVKHVSELLLAIIGPDRISVLLNIEQNNDPREMKKSAVSIAKQILYSVENNTNMTVSIGIGNFYEDPRNLNLSFTEALYAQNHKFFIGNNQVISIDDVKPFHINVRFLPYEREADVLRKLSLGQREEARESLRQLILEILQDKTIEPSTLKMQALEFLVLVARAVKEGGVDSRKFLNIQFDFAHRLQIIDTAEELEKWMYEVLDSFVSVVLEEHNQYSLKAVREAFQYIEENFDQGLTLENVARHVCLSPNYFSTIFKKETGRTFVDYLTEARMKKAKELLEQYEYNVTQVAMKVGYNDSRYFSRVFRTVVGITPISYKNGKRKGLILK